MSDKVEVKSIKLSNGIDFPMIGLGTFRVYFDLKIKIFKLLCSEFYQTFLDFR